MDRLVVIGGGQAAFQLAASARGGGYEGDIAIVSAEAEAPYQRPPLSKGYLLGKVPRESLLLQKPAYFGTHRIDLICGVRAVRIDRDARQVWLDDGRRLGFSALVLATGGRNRRLAVDGAGLDGILGLRNLADADGVRDQLACANRVVVVGGGFIGLEFAAVARALGKSVTIIEAQRRLMARAVSEVVSDHLRSVHQRRGVSIELGTSVAHFGGSAGRVETVELADGRSIGADLVMVGVGIVPNDEIAADAGLETGDGVRVDAGLRTSDPHIFAIGDCAAFPSPEGGFHRLESVQNAVDQARHVARSLAGSVEDYRVVPWFWSDQYDEKLQIVGLAAAADEVLVRGAREAGRFSVYRFRRDRLVCVESLNQPVEHVTARKLLARASPVLRAEIAAQDMDLRKLLHA